MENKLNKSKILKSLIWIPMVMPLTAIPAALFGMELGSENLIELIVGITFYGLTFGVIFWLPAILIFLTLESLFIREESTENTVKIIFISEVMISLLIMGYIVRTTLFGIPLLALFIGVISTQFFRLLYLQRKNRMYKTKPSDDMLIDEIE